MIWSQVILSARDSQLATPGQTLGDALVQSPQFWMLTTVTISIASPWLNLRHVVVDPEALSDHAIRLRFNYAVPVNGSFARVSGRLLVEIFWLEMIEDNSYFNDRFLSTACPAMKVF